MALEHLTNLLDKRDYPPDVVHGVRIELGKITQCPSDVLPSWMDDPQLVLPRLIVDNLDFLARSELEAGGDEERMGEALGACLRLFAAAGALFGEAGYTFGCPRPTSRSVDAILTSLVLRREEGDKDGAFACLLDLWVELPRNVVASAAIEEALSRGGFLQTDEVSLLHSIEDRAVPWEEWVSFVEDVLLARTWVHLHYWRPLRDPDRSRVVVRAALPRHLSRTCRGS